MSGRHQKQILQGDSGFTIPSLADGTRNDSV